MSKQEKPRGFIAALEKFVQWRAQNRPSISSVTLAVRSKTVRRKLGLKKDEPLVYKGLSINCVGSKRWRTENQPLAGQPRPQA